ncbi:phosphotransferase [Paenibacillus luteus]|uniref:phosphotransferase n=1 Tax=Paenibacillus luteus TaxID=2545753 RepID=UPI001143672E|nr:phosphotransferase [Paenibacillus luteus]
MIAVQPLHTVFNKDQLFEAISPFYSIGKPVQTRFLSNGLNDTYAVDTDCGKYILRIYKHQWRTESAIRFELDLLTYLNNRMLPISYPIAREDGEWLTELDAPEGKRYAVLFTYADGIGKVDASTSATFGTSVAQLHLAMDHYTPKHERFELDTKHLLDEPLRQLLPFLQHRAADAQLVQEIADRLKLRLTAASGSTYNWGACHGDLHGWNVFHQEDGSLTHFDFDCCGIGWRAYDLSVFLWDRVHGNPDSSSFEDECWRRFLEAYTKERALSEEDLAIIPVFVAVRQIWLMGLHTGQSAVWGAWQDDGYFDGKLKFLTSWVNAQQL